MKKYQLIKLILCLLIFNGSMQAQSFNFHSEDPFGIDLDFLDSFELTLKYEFYDRDNDGDQDLFMFGFVLGDLTELSFDSIDYFIDYQENIGSAMIPEFGPKERAFESFDYHRGPFLPSIGDINGDSQFDIVALSDIEFFTGMQNVSIYINDQNPGADEFERIDGVQYGFNQLKPQSFLWPELFDLDMDGDLDLLASGNTSGDFDIDELIAVSIYAKNVGTNTDPGFISWFENPFNIKDDEIEELMKAGDLDNDGDPDVLSVVRQDEMTKLLFKENVLNHNGRPLFAEAVESPYNLPVFMDGKSIIDFELVDIDGDSDLDFFVFVIDENTEELSVQYYVNELCVTSEVFVDLSICEGESVQVGNQDFSEEGSYTVNLTDASGCDSIVNLSLVVSSPDLSLTLDESTLTAVSGQASYQWINCETQQIIPGAVQNTYTAETSGLYAVEIIDEQGCLGTSDCVSVIVSSTEDEAFQNAVTIFPNPTNELIYIENKSGIAFDRAYLMNMNGHKIIQLKARQNHIDLSQLNEGVYLFVFEHMDKRLVKKISKYNF